MADAGIVLAAGTGSRMGRTKQLLPWQGSPLLSRVLAACLKTALSPLILVLGHAEDRIRCALEVSGPISNKITIASNPDYRSGMASSIRAGLAALNAASGSPRGALFVLGDQPLISPAAISAILKAAEHHRERIIIPAHRGRRGNPVYFPSLFFKDLTALSGDRGGRVLFERYPERVTYIDLPPREIHTDLDTPGDYRRLLADHGEVAP